MIGLLVGFYAYVQLFYDKLLKGCKCLVKPRAIDRCHVTRYESIRLLKRPSVGTSEKLAKHDQTKWKFSGINAEYSA